MIVKKVVYLTSVIEELLERLYANGRWGY